MKRKFFTENRIRGSQNHMNWWLCALLVCLITLVFPYTALAQVGAASLNGVVQDQTAASVPGATVTLTNIQTGMERAVESNGTGMFHFAAVTPGDYRLAVKMKGFRDLVRTGIHLNPGDAIALQGLTLNLGTTSETVSVEDTIGTIPLDSGQLSATIASTDIDRLSIVGRDATELQRILPGFSIRSQDNTNSAPDFSQVNIGMGNPYVSNGAPVAGTTLKLDGASLTDPGNMGASLQNLNVAFVSEVQVQSSNFGADQSNGPVIITGVTKPGTQAYHGTLYTFGRFNQLNSNDSIGKYSGLARPNDRYIYPGATISGPVPGSKKLTFFAGAEWDVQKNVYAYNSASSALVNALVPTQKMRDGDFSAAALDEYFGAVNRGNYSHISSVPTLGPDFSPLTNGNISQFLDPNVMRLVNAVLPLPNIKGGTNADGYNYHTMNLVNNNVFQSTGRLDYAIDPHNSIWLRYSYEHENQGQPQVPYYAPTSIMGAVNTPGGGLLNQINVHSASASYVTILNPTTTNELTGTLTYFSEDFVPVNLNALLKSTVGYTYNGIFDNGSKEIPQLGTYDPYGGLPLAIYPDFTTGGLFLHKMTPAVTDNLTKVAGKHTLKLGVFGQKVINNQANHSQANGVIQNYWYADSGNWFTSYNGKYPDGSPAFGGDFGPHSTSGNALANFFEGEIQDFHQESWTPHTNMYYWNFEGFAQDAWRVSPSVVLTYGLRVAHLGAWSDTYGQGPAMFTPETMDSAYNATTNPLPGFQWHATNPKFSTSGVGSHRVYLEPRVGVAWDVFKNGKTVVRGGYGAYRFHDAADDARNAFETGSGLRKGDLQGFNGNDLAGVDTVHQNPYTYGNANGTQTSLPVLTVNALMPGDNKSPVTNNYSLSITQQVNKNTVFQISYAGNNSNSMMNNGTTQAVVLNNVNAIPIGYLFTPAAAATINSQSASWLPTPCTGVNGNGQTVCTPLNISQNVALTEDWVGRPSVQMVRPYSKYGNIIVPRHNTYANYNAMQAMLVKQMGNLTYNINYTWSKAMGILGSAADFNYTAPVDPFNMRNNYGPMNYDRSHILNLSYSYQFGRLTQNRGLGLLANGWLVSGITTLQSGGNMQTGVSFSPDFYLQGTLGDGTTISSASMLGTPDVSLQPTLKCNPGSGLAKNQYINASCFALPTGAGTPGVVNGSYVMPYVHGPAYINSDLSVEKAFTVGEKSKLRFRYAAFNFLNHPLHSFGTPYALQSTLQMSGATAATAVSSNPNFGYAPLTVGRRLSEISLKYEF